MKKTKILIIFLILVMTLSTCVFATDVSMENVVSENIENIEETVQEEGMQFHSSAAVLIEQNTGEVLYDYNMNEKLYPASITKILTCILAIENCDLNEKAVASEYAIKSIPDGYTMAGILPGEEFTVEELLEVTMLRSANEAATILAEHVSGSVEEFAKLMNKKAAEIGCKNSNFLNANGMHNDNHYSTAYDMALIQRYCMQNKEYRRISSMTFCALPNTPLYDKDVRGFKNTHAFLIPENKNYYEYTISGKTGFTTPAKNTLVTSAQKNGLQLVAVVLHAEGNIDGVSARYFDTKQLFEYGFENFKSSDFKEIENQNKDKEVASVETVASVSSNDSDRNNSSKNETIDERNVQLLNENELNVVNEDNNRENIIVIILLTILGGLFFIICVLYFFVFRKENEIKLLEKRIDSLE